MVELPTMCIIQYVIGEDRIDTVKVLERVGNGCRRGGDAHYQMDMAVDGVPAEYIWGGLDGLHGREEFFRVGKAGQQIGALGHIQILSPGERRNDGEIRAE